MESLLQRNFRYCKYRAVSNGAAVADVNMDFNRKTFEKLLLKHGKSNQEIAKEINDFVLVLMYSSTLTLEAMIGWLSVGYLER
jgi:hypothetical protein